MRLDLSLFFLAALPLVAATDPRIAIATVAVDAQGNASIDVAFIESADHPVAALQFDVSYPAAIQGFSASAGAAADSAQKSLFAAAMQPGATRILLVGMNSNVIAGGVVATLSVQAKSAAPALYPLTIGNVFAVDPNGGAVSLSGDSGGVVVSGAGVTAPAITEVSNAASYVSGAVSPGEIVILKGTALGSPDGPTAQLTPAGTVATTLAGTRVFFDGVAAPLVYATPGQVSAIVPYAVDGRARTSVQLEYQGIRSAPFLMDVIPALPGIFTANASGSGLAAVVNQDFTVNGPAHPAIRGNAISIFATGEGQTTPPGSDGVLVPASDLKRPLLPVSASVGGQNAEVIYAGSAPGQVSGVLQVNVRIPASIDPGPAVPVTITVGRTSQPGVSIAVQ